MQKRYTLAELLVLARRSAGFTHVNADCSVEQVDGIDVDALLADEIRRRYLHLLDTASPTLLAPSDVASLTSFEPPPEPSAAGTVTLHSSCRRPLALRLDGWTAAARVLPAELLPVAKEWQKNPYTAATPSSPLAVLAYPGSRCELLVWPAESSAAVESALAVALDPGYPDVFLLDEAALAEIIPPSPCL